MMGAQDLLKALPKEVGDKVRVLAAPCMGRCATAPVAEVGHRHVDNATVESLLAAVAGDHHPVIPAYKDLAAYEGAGGYGLLRACLAGKRTPEELIDILPQASLSRPGGPGLPTRKEWQVGRGFNVPTRVVSGKRWSVRISLWGR